MGNMGAVMAEKIESHNHPYSADFILPPLSILILKPETLPEEPLPSATEALDLPPTEP